MDIKVVHSCSVCAMLTFQNQNGIVITQFSRVSALFISFLFLYFCEQTPNVFTRGDCSQEGALLFLVFNSSF